MVPKFKNNEPLPKITGFYLKKMRVSKLNFSTVTSQSSSPLNWTNNLALPKIRFFVFTVVLVHFPQLNTSSSYPH